MEDGGVVRVVHWVRRASRSSRWSSLALVAAMEDVPMTVRLGPG